MGKASKATRYEVRDEDDHLVWPALSSYDEARSVAARLKADRPLGSFKVKHVDVKVPKPIDCDRIIERHAALGCTEVALVQLGKDDAGLPWYAVELITAHEDGTYDRANLHTGCVAENIKTIRLMDFHCGVVAAQRALGMTINRQFA